MREMLTLEECIKLVGHNSKYVPTWIRRSISRSIKHHIAELTKLRAENKQLKTELTELHHRLCLFGEPA